MRLLQYIRHHRTLTILVGILFLGAFLRFFLLRNLPPGLYPDEAMNGNNASAALATGHFSVFYPENNGREGLFIFLQGISLLIFKIHAAWVLRFPSAVIGTLTIWGFFLLLRELSSASKLTKSNEVALFGSFFLATSTWHLMFSRDGFRAISAPCVGIFALYFLLRAFRSHSLWWMVAAAVTMGLGFYTYTAFRVLPFVLLAFIPLWWREKKKIQLGVSFTAIFGITLIPLIRYFLAHPDDLWGHSDQISVFNQLDPWSEIGKNVILTCKMIFMVGDSNWRHNINSIPEVFWPVAVCLVMGMLLGTVRRSLFDRVLGLWLILAMIPVVFSDQAMPHALRSILMIPPLFGFAASGSQWIYEKMFEPLTISHRRVALIVIGLCIFLNTFFAYFVDWANRPEVAYAYTQQYVTLSDQIKAMPISTQKNVVLWSSDLSLCAPSICVQSVMFLTDTYLPEQQKEKNVYYWSKAEYLSHSGTLPGVVFFLN